MTTISRSEQIDALAAALAQAQSVMGGAVKDSANPFFKSRYADLSSVVDACRGPLTANGIAVIQSPSAEGPRVSVETLLVHASGQWVSGTVTTTAKDDSPQSIGSAITYLRRYGLQSFVGIAPVDDDAEAAQGRPAPQDTAPKGYQDALDDLRAAPAEDRPKILALWSTDYRRHFHATNPKAFAALGGKL